MALTATLFAQDDGERRDADRQPVARESTLRDGESRPHAAIVHDLSRDGCSIESALPLSTGEAICIGLPGVGRRDAVVVRVEGRRAGCRFTVPLSADALTRAFVGDPVVRAEFALSAPDLSAEPEIDRWHPAVRLAIVLGGATALWAAILALI